MNSKSARVFNTDKRIRLGIWGLGRGMSFYRTCGVLNIDVVAGCDYNEHMRKGFLQCNPKAFATADAKEFLAQDFDAVLLATYCPAHADDAIQCLRAGKHVLSEVTAFHTMAEGVRLVEEVEKSGKVYNLAENYPFSPANMYLARKWKEGLFGDLMYAEYEYVHECRSLAYTYIDGLPVQPGWTLHSWRSWLNFHYYCTHSLGPVMVITGTRPTRVVALPGRQMLHGYPMKDARAMGGITPSLITMSNGGVVRNLMGATTNDSHQQRLWGTLGAAEIGHDGLQLRLGGSGGSPKLKVNPTLDALSLMASKTGHGGGDFWVLYYFARQILTGERGPFDVYSACDVTIPGILAYRSSLEDGKAYDIPDFRKPDERERSRTDTWTQERYDYRNGVFPKGHDVSITGRFTTVMKALIDDATAYRAYADWKKVAEDLREPGERKESALRLLGLYPGLVDTYREARRIIDAYPTSDGARMLRDMLEVGEEKVATSPAFLKALKSDCAKLERLCPDTKLFTDKASASMAVPMKGAIRNVALPAKGTKFSAVPYVADSRLLDIRKFHDGKDGLVYIRTTIKRKAAGAGTLLYGADGPVKVWVNGKAVDCRPKASNPAIADEYPVPLRWKKGANEVLFALHTNNGRAWGVIVRAG